VLTTIFSSLFFSILFEIKQIADMGITIKKDYFLLIHLFVQGKIQIYESINCARGQFEPWINY